MRMIQHGSHCFADVEKITSIYVSTGDLWFLLQGEPTDQENLVEDKYIDSFLKELDMLHGPYNKVSQKIKKLLKD